MCPKLGQIRTENAICTILQIVSETLDKEGLQFDFGHGMARKRMYFDP